MSRSVSTIINANNALNDVIMSFGNGFGHQVAVAFEGLRTRIEDIEATLTADGFESLVDASAEGKTVLGVDDRVALAMESTLIAIANIKVALNAIDTDDALLMQGTALKEFIDTTAQNAPNLHRV